MIKKKFLFLIFIIFLNSCGYTPMYSKNNKKDFLIENIEFSGDRELNNFIDEELLIYYENKESSRKFTVKINSEYNKDILSKDITGKIENYLIKILITFNIKSSDEERKLTVNENFTMKNIEILNEQKFYEQQIKKNLSYSAVNKLILFLSKNQ